MDLGFHYTHWATTREASSNNFTFQTGSHPLLCSCSRSQRLLYHQHLCQLYPRGHCCCCPQRLPMVPALCAVRLGAQQTADSESRRPGFQSFGDHCRCTSNWQKEAGHKKPTEFRGKHNAEGPPVTWSGEKDVTLKGHYLQEVFRPCRDHYCPSLFSFLLLSLLPSLIQPLPSLSCLLFHKYFPLPALVWQTLEG